MTLSSHQKGNFSKQAGDLCPLVTFMMNVACVGV